MASMNPPNLTIPRDQAAEQLTTQIEGGLEIKNIPIDSPDHLKHGETQESEWLQYNLELLTRIFDNQSEAQKFQKYGRRIFGTDMSLDDEREYFRDRMGEAVAHLQVLLKRLPLISQPEGAKRAADVPDSGNLDFANTLYRKAKALFEHVRPLDEYVAQLLIESANDAISEYGSTNQERKVELKKMIAEAEKILPPATIKELRERAEGHVLQRTYPRKPLGISVLLSVIGVMLVLGFIWYLVKPVVPPLNNQNGVSQVKEPTPAASSIVASDPAPVSLVVIPNISANNLETSLASLRTAAQLRSISPLESGKSIQETPSGTFFFSFVAYLEEYRLGDRTDVLKRGEMNPIRTTDSDFEVHKISEDNIKLISFVPTGVAETISRLDGRSRKEATLSGVPWADANTLIVLPIDRILSAKQRQLTMTDGHTLRVLTATLR